MARAGIGAALALLVLPVRAAPVISWISAPLRPNDTAIVVGGGFDESCSVTLTPASNSSGPFSAPVISNHTTESTLKFTVPADVPSDSWEVGVACAGGTSPGFLVNQPEPWWVQGDVGATATQGGWVRVLGMSLSNVDARVAEIRQQLRDLRERVTAHYAATDDPAGDDSLLGDASAQIVALRAQLAQLPATQTRLRLSPIIGGAAVELTAAPANATQFSAEFAVPSALTPGEYAVSISSGLGGWVPLDSFVSADAPHVSTLTVTPPIEWPAGVWVVSQTSVPAQLPGAPTSDDALDAALAAAAGAGGGTVQLLRGQYFLTRAILVPPRTRLVGAGMGLTGVYFREDTKESAPPAYITLNTNVSTTPLRVRAGSRPPSATAWGISDLTIFVSAYHNIVIDVANTTDGFFMRRVRTRVNAFFGQNGLNTPTRGRWLNATSWEVMGNTLQLNGVNGEVTDCELYGTYDVVSSQRASCSDTTWPNNCHGAFYLYMARNVIFNGGGAHKMNQWAQTIFEHNVIQGVSQMSMGQAAGTADGGVVHNMYIGDNTYQFVYGNDREVMTFDCAGGIYFGGVESTNGSTLVLASDPWPVSSMNWGGYAGGSIAIVNGTGAGQWRRIVVPGVNMTLGLSNRTWVLDAPFTVQPLPNDSLIQILPFRGRNIWHRNTYKDAGAVQFYGHSISNIVSETHAERFGGIISWGQWRNWTVPGSQPQPPGACAVGVGIQPNMQNQWLNNTVKEGITIMNYNCSATGGTRGSACGESFYLGHSYVTQGPYFVADSTTPYPQHLANVYRDSAGHSNSGFLVSSSTSNAVVEGSVFAQSDRCVTVQEGTDLIFVRGSSCTSD